MNSWKIVSSLTNSEKDKYTSMITLLEGTYQMSDELLLSSLQTLSELLYKHYGKKTIILIDEYDVPLDKAFPAWVLSGNGYFDTRNVWKSIKNQ